MKKIIEFILSWMLISFSLLTGFFLLHTTSSFQTKFITSDVEHDCLHILSCIYNNESNYVVKSLTNGIVFLYNSSDAEWLVIIHYNQSVNHVVPTGYRLVSKYAMYPQGEVLCYVKEEDGV